MYPISSDQLQELVSKLNISSLTAATIRQIVALAKSVEQHTGTPVIHLEIGNPGLPSNALGVTAEKEALTSGVAGAYPPIMGIDAIKKAGSKFIKAFVDTSIPSRCIVPSVGSMQGSFCVMMLLAHRDKKKDTMLYLDPGFAPQHLQCHLLGMKQVSFDIYSYRGKALEAKLEEVLSAGNITGMLYSNPNNPAWTNFTEEELEIIGRLATKYDTVVIEDLAYMGMDFRTYCGEPGVPPFIPSVSKYTSNYIILVSASKIFSYAGQRVALMCMSPELAERREPLLKEFFGMPTFIDAYIFGIVYAVSSGVTHSAQHAMAAMLNAAAEGRIDFVKDSMAYRDRCARARKIFMDNGFSLVYADDAGVPVSDGFFFTVTYGEMDSETLQRELLRYGVASISLPGTGSTRHGLRICPSRMVNDEEYFKLEERLKAFSHDHPQS